MPGVRADVYAETSLNGLIEVIVFHYLQTMDGLSFASSRQAWCCFAAVAASVCELGVAAATTPFGVTAGATEAAG